MHSHEFVELGCFNIEFITGACEAHLPLLKLPLVCEHLFLDIGHLLLNLECILACNRSLTHLELELFKFGLLQSASE